MTTPFVDIVTIGTEIVRGEIADTNAAWIGEQLYLNGFSVGRILSVDDDMERMTTALQEAAGRAKAVIVSGGLGPTVDDITAAAAAQVCGVGLRRDEEALRQMAERLSSVGLMVTPNNEKQADIPEGATVLYNDAGTAPGFATPAAAGRAPMFFLPGVPRELKRLFTRQVLPMLQAEHPNRTVVVSRRLRLFGTGESKIDYMLKKQVEQFAGGDDTEVSFRASWPEILVTLRARGASEEEARPKVDAAVAQCREIVGQYLYGEGDVTLAATVGQALREKGMTLATAESCTGGGLAAMITDEPGSSDYFAGAIVAYANDVKERLLGVPATMLAEHGAVSDPVARQMALGRSRGPGHVHRRGHHRRGRPRWGHRGKTGRHGSHCGGRRRGNRDRVAGGGEHPPRVPRYAQDDPAHRIVHCAGHGPRPHSRGLRPRVSERVMAGDDGSTEIPSGGFVESPQDDEASRPEEKWVEHVRAFIALEPSIPVLRKVSRAQERLREAWEAADGPRVKWVAVEHSHVTLKFLGSIPAPLVEALADMLKDVARQLRPIKVHVRNLGSFGGRSPRVLWAGIEDAGGAPLLAKTATAVSEACAGLGFEPEKRTFRPHLTLGRIKERKKGFEADQVISGISETDFGPMTFSELILYRSELTKKGAIYTSLARASLSRRRNN